MGVGGGTLSSGHHPWSTYDAPPDPKGSCGPGKGRIQGDQGKRVDSREREGGRWRGW